MATDERHKDREEYKALWRETQRHVDDLSLGLIELRRQVSDLAVGTRLRLEEIAEQSRAADEKSRVADQQLRDRINSMVSAFGEHLRQGH